MPDLGDFDLLGFGARSGLLWRRPGLTLAGLGVARTFPRPDLGSTADIGAALAEMTGENALPDVPGTGAVAFGALPFDRHAPGRLIVPEILLGADDEGHAWLTIVSAGRPNPTAVITNLIQTARRPVSVPDATCGWNVSSTLTPEYWRDAIVERARDRIRTGALRKAVFAREIVFSSDEEIDAARVVLAAAEVFPTANLFAIDGFVGASPELLVQRRGSVVQAHPLAGTAPRHDDPSEDRQAAEALRASSKDRSEHQITIDWFLNELLPFCSYVDAEPEPTIVSIANVHHLGTRVEGVLSSPPASILDLVAAVHPTPAVGGDPQGDALVLIAELEEADRGAYAGPAGWIDAAGNGAFAVSVRTARVAGREASMFSGVGVVAGSDPQAELDETRAKVRAMLGPLLAPWPGADRIIDQV